MTNHLAHTAREVHGWLGSSLPTDGSLIGQVAPKTDLQTHLAIADSILSRPEDPEDLIHNIEWLLGFRRMGLAS